MKTPLFAVTLLAFAIFAFSCQPQPTTLTDTQKAAVADSAKAVVQLMLANANKLDFVAYFNHYSADPDSRYIENGSLYPSLEAMKKNYADNLSFESLNNTPDTWDMIVLSSDAVVITMPFHFSFKPKGLPEYKAQGVWTGVVQRRSGKWAIIQSHESWIDPEKVMAALMPSSPKQSRPKK
jgi:ketosteroid isomerase-like protein